MPNIRLVLKRGAVTFGELLIELIIAGIYLGILMAAYSPGPILGVVIIVFAVLLSVGYYFTRPLLGLCWGNGNPLWYGVLSALLFVGHMYVGYLGNRTGMSPKGHEVVVPYLIGSWVIVATTASAGRWCLRKWSGRIRLTSSKV
jgi:asparagine N-glycosylation enzyme membrane subunit Stt3